jgi:FtsZ-interacting cell division protein ZipA
MSTGLIIAIVIVALIVLAALLIVGRKGRQKRHETRRGEAREIRREAEVSRAHADHSRAEADERAARARREEAGARRHAAEADARAHEARERHLDAARRDPDTDEDEFAERYDREHGAGRGDQGTQRGTAGSRDRGNKPSLKQRLFGGGGDGDEGVVREDVRRERDAETGRVRHEEVTGRHGDDR